MAGVKDKRRELEALMRTLWFRRNYDAGNFSEEEVERKLAIARKGKDKASISKEDFNYLLGISEDSEIWN